MYTRQSGAEVIKALEGNQENGLSSIQVEVRREKYGSNRLKERKEKGALQLFLEQLQDPLIYILMAAIAISLFLGGSRGRRNHCGSDPAKWDCRRDTGG